MWGTDPNAHFRAVPMCIQLLLENHLLYITLVQTLLSKRIYHLLHLHKPGDVLQPSFSGLINKSPSYYISLLCPPPHSSLECFGTAWNSGCLGKTISFIMHRQSTEHFSQSRWDREIEKNGARNAEKRNDEKCHLVKAKAQHKWRHNYKERNLLKKNKILVWWLLLIHKKTLFAKLMYLQM